MAGEEQLKSEFHKQMLRIADQVKEECNYNPQRFRNTVDRKGGFEAARQFLCDNKVSDGLIELWQEGRLDLSMEALILQNPWRQLFTDEEIAKAGRRLQDLGYTDCEE